MFTICTKDTSLQPIWTIFDQHWGTSSAGINHVSDDERESGVEPGGEPEPSPESVGDSALHGSSVGEDGPEDSNPLIETIPDDSQPVGETVLDDPMPSLPDLGIPEDTWDPAARESDEEPGDLAPCAVCDKVGPMSAWWTQALQGMRLRRICQQCATTFWGRSSVSGLAQQKRNNVSPQI